MIIAGVASRKLMRWKAAFCCVGGFGIPKGKLPGGRSSVTMHLLGGAIGCCRSWHVSVLEALLLNAILSDL